MNLPQHFLHISHDDQRRAMRHWLMLGVAALGVAGIFAGMLANTKSSYFYMALVAHVDLSVLVWFLSFSCLLMVVGLPASAWDNPIIALLGRAGILCATLGAGCIAASAFAHGVPFQNNYIPVIYHPLFFMGLALLFCGVMCQVAQFMCARNTARLATPVQAGIVSVAALLLMAVFCFLWSYRSMPKDVHGQSYYEHVFWAGGHVLQIVYVQVMMIAWLWLAEMAGIKLIFSRKMVLLCYTLGVLAGVGGVALSLLFPPATTQHHDAFTALMRDANGLPPIILGVGLVLSIMKSTSARSLEKISLVMSLLLFSVGGGLGYLIAGSNETIPAHYHGSIVGVTLALMGMAYVFSPKVGWADMSQNALAKWQPVLYGGGQLCWMAGMAIGGAQGIGRKIPGSADVIGGVGGFLKHGGDGLSLIGGLLFVYVMIRAIRQKNKA